MIRYSRVARYTRAYCSFTDDLNQLERPLLTRKRSRSTDLQDLDRASINNILCRASIVLLSAAMERYVRNVADIVLERVCQRKVAKCKLPDFQYYLSNDIVRELCQSQDPKKVTKKVTLLFQRDGCIWSENEVFPTRLYDTHHKHFVLNITKGITSPKVGNVVTFMKRVGCSTYLKDLKSRLKGRYLPCENMVNRIVERRNQIAHGEVRETFTPTEVIDMVRLARLFFRESDVVLANWYRDSVRCPIR